MIATIILPFVGGLVLLLTGAEALVKGAAKIAESLGLPRLVIGLTVVALGTSAPEVAVSVLAAVKGQPDVAVGNVVGSNIFNILVILGVTALVAPLLVSKQLVSIDVPIMIGVSALLFGLAMDGLVSRLDGLILLTLGIAYVAALLRACSPGGILALDDGENRERPPDSGAG